MKMLLAVLFCCHLVTVFAVRERYDEVDELKRKLFSNYNSDTIPASAKKGIQVETGLSMLHMDLTDKGVLEFSAYFTLKWKDSRLQWSSDDYSDIKDLRINADALWVPDTEMFNALEFGPGSFSELLRKRDHPAVVYPSGDVLYIPPVNGRVQCNDKEFADWPWGEYDCNIVMGSWTYEGALLNTTLYADQNYISSENTVGTATSSPVFFTENSFKENAWENTIYDCCPEAYPKLDFKFKVQRAYRMTPQGKEMNPNPKPAFKPKA